MSLKLEEKTLQEKFKRLQKLSESLQKSTSYQIKSFEKTIKKSSKPLESETPRQRDQGTSPEKRKLSIISFEIYHHEPSPLTLVQTFCKENLAELNNEIKPLELEITRLKQLQDDLKSQIMAAKIIERENDLKTEFLLSRRDFQNDNLIDEKSNKSIQEKEIFDSNLWDSEPICFEIEEQGYMKKAFEKKKIDKNFEKSKRNNQIILEKNDAKQISGKKGERDKILQDSHFNKENIDRLTEEIEELLSLQRIGKKQFGNLSEIKEVSFEESFF